MGRIVAQMSWNILLNPIPGGDTFIFDRQWQAPQDDMAWRKEFPKYAYDPRMVEGHAFKVVKPTPGDLYWFNPRRAVSCIFRNTQQEANTAVIETSMK
jgi:hypothetical protein